MAEGTAIRFDLASSVRMKSGKALVWLRRDFRLHDQAALHHAAKDCQSLVPVFILDPATLDSFAPGLKPHAAFFGSLLALREKLQSKGRDILLREGNPEKWIPELTRKFEVTTVYYNKDYEPQNRQRDLAVEAKLTLQGTRVRSFKDHVIFEESEVLSGAGTPMKVFTPYKNAALKRLKAEGLPAVLSAPQSESFDTTPFPDATSDALWKQIEEMVENGKAEASGLIPETGETAARVRLRKFLEGPVAKYADQRNFPANSEGHSRLSMDFRAGSVSCRFALQSAWENEAPQAQRDLFISELFWHDFFIMIGHHFPHVFQGNFNAKYDGLKWRNDEAEFQAWCEGRTGYPIVDAGMRELVKSGFMHNRVRMVVAMFLVKDLLVDWRWGEKFFRQHLVDADWAINNGNWQWSASTGVDAAPYFRIFNPMTQGEKFDADGEYIRKWIPELARVPGKAIHKLEKSPLLLAPEYPAQVVDHSVARDRTLAAYNRALAR